MTYTDTSTQVSRAVSREASPAPPAQPRHTSPGILQRHALKLMIPIAGIAGAGLGAGITKWKENKQARERLNKNVRALRVW